MSATLQERLRHGIDIARAERSTIPENHRIDKLRIEAAARIDALEARERELVGALRDAETTIGENLVWIHDQADLGVRQRDAETLRRLKQLDTGWQALVKSLALLAPASAEVRK